MERIHFSSPEARHPLVTVATVLSQTADRLRHPFCTSSSANRLRIPGWAAAYAIGAVGIATTVGLAGHAIEPRPVPQFPTEQPFEPEASSTGKDHPNTQLPITVIGNKAIATDTLSYNLIFDVTKANIESISELDEKGNLTTSMTLTGDDGTEAVVTDNGNGTFTVLFK